MLKAFISILNAMLNTNQNTVIKILLTMRYERRFYNCIYFSKFTKFTSIFKHSKRLIMDSILFETGKKTP